MHPAPTFAWTDRSAMLQFIGEQAFAHIFAAGTDGLCVVHAPVLVTADEQLQFHVARRNRIAGELAGNTALISVVGRHGYHSANWYASDNQVPTWHYEAVEAEGPVRILSHDALVEQLDALSETYERRVEPDHPWTRAKMDPAKFLAMTRAIVGFELDPKTMRGTRKFNQHKAPDDLAATLAGQRRAGREDLVAAIEEMARAR